VGWQAILTYFTRVAPDDSERTEHAKGGVHRSGVAAKVDARQPSLTVRKITRSTLRNSGRFGSAWRLPLPLSCTARNVSCM
jgi:hypothetical protein